MEGGGGYRRKKGRVEEDVMMTTEAFSRNVGKVFQA